MDAKPLSIGKILSERQRFIVPRTGAILRLSIFATAFAITPAAAQPSILAFQGLSGTSNQADVLRVFSKAKAENSCSAGQASNKSADGEVACGTLKVETYVVDNTTFELTFMFTLEGKLRYVSLLRIYGIPGPDGSGVPKSEIAIRYASMADLLSTRYGPAVREAPGAMFRSSTKIGELEWQPGRGQEWQEGGDRLKLSADAMERSQSPGTYWGSVHVFYTFARRGESGRL